LTQAFSISRLFSYAVIFRNPQPDKLDGGRQEMNKARSTPEAASKQAFIPPLSMAPYVKEIQQHPLLAENAIYTEDSGSFKNEAV
jgi:hypothetical protein